MVAAPVPAAAAPKILPVVMVLGAVGAVGGYITSQLKTNSRQMDKFFSSYNTPESEASRRRTFEGVNTDPRTSLFNALGRK